MAWYHRRLCLDNLKELDIKEELNWLDSIALENQKNYQIWHHRKVIIEKLNDPSHEKKVLNEIFADEPKNFHGWCHRIWVVRRFNLIEGEFEFVDKLLKEDVRNNSAWNYRFFLIKFTNSKIDDEIEYTLNKIALAPMNESPYSYLRGFFQPQNNENKIYMKDFPNIKSSLEIIISEYPECYHAYSLLTDVYLEEKNSSKCLEIIDNLIEIDYIRKKYWNWRKIKINELLK
jgi:protein farnesyltransferase/geranylgeranyltransferase type-1 subunit alpha